MSNTTNGTISMKDHSGDAPSYLEAGVHINVNITEIALQNTKNDKPYISIKGISSDDKALGVSLFGIFSGDKIFVRKDFKTQEDIETEDEAFERIQSEKIRDIKHIWKAFVDEEVINKITVNSFEELQKAFIESVGKSGFKDIPVNIKLVYKRNSAFTEFPKKPPFIEKYVAGVKPTLSIGARDNMTPVAVQAPTGEDAVAVEGEKMPWD